MTKAEIVAQIAEKTGLEKSSTQVVVEAFMDVVKEAVAKGEPVYLRGFGSFIRKERKEKVGRNITDHRIGMSIFQMENFLNGNIDEMIDNLIAADRAERLKGEN